MKSLVLAAFACAAFSVNAFAADLDQCSFGDGQGCGGFDVVKPTTVTQTVDFDQCSFGDGQGCGGF